MERGSGVHAEEPEDPDANDSLRGRGREKEDASGHRGGEEAKADEGPESEVREDAGEGLHEQSEDGGGGARAPAAGGQPQLPGHVGRRGGAVPDQIGGEK